MGRVHRALLGCIQVGRGLLDIDASCVSAHHQQLKMKCLNQGHNYSVVLMKSLSWVPDIAQAMAANDTLCETLVTNTWSVLERGGHGSFTTVWDLLVDYISLIWYVRTSD